MCWPDHHTRADVTSDWIDDKSKVATRVMALAEIQLDAGRFESAARPSRRSCAKYQFNQSCRDVRFESKAVMSDVVARITSPARATQAAHSGQR